MRYFLAPMMSWITLKTRSTVPARLTLPGQHARVAYITHETKGATSPGVRRGKTGTIASFLPIATLPCFDGGVL